MGDVDRAREEDAVQVSDGPGGPGHEPDLLGRIAAAARERRRRMARPDVPPQDHGGHGEADQGDEVEADRAKAPLEPSAIGRSEGSMQRWPAPCRRVVGTLAGTGPRRLGRRSAGVSDSVSDGASVDTSIPLVTAIERTAGACGHEVRTAGSYDRRRARRPPLPRHRRRAARSGRRVGHVATRLGGGRPGGGRRARPRALRLQGRRAHLPSRLPRSALRRDGGPGPGALARTGDDHGATAPPRHRPGDAWATTRRCEPSLDALEAAGAPVERVAASDAAAPAARHRGHGDRARRARLRRAGGRRVPPCAARGG